MVLFCAAAPAKPQCHAPPRNGVPALNGARLFKCSSKWNTIFQIWCYRLDNPAGLSEHTSEPQF